MKRNYFTSDWHLYHSNIIKYNHRPFKGYQEMNATILQNYFKTVKKGDSVYFLGDFAFGRKVHKEEIASIIKEITNGINFHVILGNHDHKDVRKLFKEYASSMQYLKEITIEDQSITMCHYPMISYNKSHWNAWQLYGHHHRPTGDLVPGKKWNVGVDVNAFNLLSFEDLKEIMAKRDSNWDYITPEMVSKRKRTKKLEREIQKIEKTLHTVQEKIEKEFTERTPLDIVNYFQNKKENLESQLNQKKFELKQI